MKFFKPEDFEGSYFGGIIIKKDEAEAISDRANAKLERAGIE